MRRAEEMRLLRLWHDTVTEGGAHKYSWDEALYDYRTAVLYCNIYTIIALGTMDRGNERGLALHRKWVERRSAAIEDLDAGEVMPRG
jgi:hypothetical protein